MQAYGQGFARVYNGKWSAFAERVGPYVIDYYESTPTGQTNKSILDLCCGTGQLAVLFLERGYSVVGVDLSPNMLQCARKNAQQFIDSGQCRFVHADAADFSLDERFGLVVSTYDSLNHLEDERALAACFRRVHAVNDDLFIFDLNTRMGLKNWNSTRVSESPDDTLIINRGDYDGESDRATMTFTGFTVTSDGKYVRFDETVFNTVFELKRVKELLLEIGWTHVHFARIDNLSSPLAEPENDGRVFVIARKLSAGA